MKKDRIPHILFCILAVLAFAPMLQEHLHFPPVKPLAGVTEPINKPQLTWKDYRNGQYQKKLERYLQHHFGYRPAVIRLYNQYLWDFYKKTFVKPGVLSFGKEGWMYEPWFVEDYYHGGTYSQKMDSLTMAKEFDKEALRLYQLQHILERHGITLFVCQAPGKDLIYPEYLPEDAHPERGKQLSARDYYEAKFEAMGINHINMEQWFLQMKDTVDFLLFPQKGTHWSNLAAIYAADSIYRYIEAKQGIKMNRMEIGPHQPGKIRKPDDDLESLLNLMRPLKKLPQQYADIQLRAIPGAVKPKMITIGDSFFWNICAQTPMDSIFSSCPYWYYNSTIHFDKLHHSTEEVDLVEELLSSDVIMLIYSSSTLYKLSNDFSKKALIKLCYDDEEIQKTKAQLVEDIKNYPSWLKSVEQRAEEYHFSLEEALRQEANQAVSYAPEYFLPALRDSIPLKESTAVRLHPRRKKQSESLNNLSLHP
jgi:hypothetical protein